MPEVLAFLSAVSYGVGDFLGGLATKRTHVLHVLGAAHAVGLTTVAFVAMITGGSPVGSDLLWGAAAGAAGLVGLGFFYWSLSMGVMGVVAPVAAAIGAAIPVFVGFAGGERPGTGAIIGVFLAILAIVLVSAGHFEMSVGMNPLSGAAISGVGFGLFFVFLEKVDEAAGMWPLVAARGTSCALILIAVIALRPRLVPSGITAGSLAGIFDIGANMLVLAAFAGGLLVIVSALAALYPVVTMLMARFVLFERLRPTQFAGLFVAVAAVTLVSIGRF